MNAQMLFLAPELPHSFTTCSRAGVQACTYLDALLIAHAAAQVPEIEVSSCARDWQGGGRVRSSQERGAFIRARLCGLHQCADAVWAPRKVLSAKGWYQTSGIPTLCRH